MKRNDPNCTYLATCTMCEPKRAMPFEDEQKRDEWAKSHAKATKHPVQLGISFS
ncbi:hypothetical protein SEA_PONS_49 [Gordonia phage Pons]|uniref:Uncharacterized protein n=1 Tax=Gordonia phage Pons TaxID=2885976 RepID=A0AAE8Y658_9CAUD|nr:hypothetical protein PP992_gp49 [Gordonia phage Pons]UDL15209.1 hypothetical protein SEA_PONS_49 [Gordonia phage Pons]